MLIVDDHAEFRGSARRLLEWAGFLVVGEAADGASAMAEAFRLRPDVILLDVQLPDFDGFEVARRLAREPARPEVILTSSRAVSDYRARLEEAPARGFIGKVDLSADTILALVGPSQ